MYHFWQSLRFKLIAATLIIEVLMLSILLWNSIRLTKEYLVQQTEFYVHGLRPLLNASVAGPLLQEDIALLDEILKQIINEQGLRYIAVYDIHNDPISQQGESAHPDPVNGKPHIHQENVDLHTYLTTHDTNHPYRYEIPLLIGGRSVGHLIYELDTRFFFNASRDVRQQGFSIAAAEVVLSLILLLVIGATLTQHLKHLTSAVLLFSRTHEYQHVETNTHDEVAQLGHAFNDMAKQISQREKERDNAVVSMQKSEARIRLLLDSTAEAIYGINEQGNCAFVNPACVSMLGYDFPSDLIGKNMHQLIHYAYEDGSDYPVAECGIYRALNEKYGVHVDKEVFWRKDGSSFPVEYWSHPIFEDNVCVGAVVTFIDITERRQALAEIHALNDDLEDRVKARTAELQASNDELRAFSYSVSHDLRSPLRGIDGYSAALAEEYGHLLDETGLNYLNRLRWNAQRMGQLIDDILKLSRVTRHEITRKDVNLSKLAETILEQLKADEPGRIVDISITPELIANGDANLLSVLLENLLGNAWKYTSKNSSTEISMDVKKELGKSIYMIKDNGVGFDMRYADKIFGAFHRLHNQDEFEGTGIGLATVQRIIHKHGGQIWADSAVMKGTTFYFTLDNS